MEPTTQKENTKNEILKLYTIEDLFKQLKYEYVEGVVGILRNCVPNQMTLDSLKNVYAGELKSLVDDNTVTVVMIEEGFSHLTQ